MQIYIYRTLVILRLVWYLLHYVPRNIILVYLACEKLPYYIIIFTANDLYISHIQVNRLCSRQLSPFIRMAFCSPINKYSYQCIIGISL